MKKNILLKDFEIEELKEDDAKVSSFVFKNLPNEFAITLGNYYRRILLSYMNGFSFFALKISNDKQELKSEFSVLEGLVETPPYLILNLKKIIFNSSANFGEKDIFELNINVKNDSDDEYIIKGSDISDSNNKIDVLNPETYIATLSPKSSLKVSIFCKKSWGFKKVENQKNEFIENNENLILIDSNYNPIINVSYSVDFIVTGMENQDEKLVIRIETNGSLSPKQALLSALDFSLGANQEAFDILSSEKF